MRAQPRPFLHRDASPDSVTERRGRSLHVSDPTRAPAGVRHAVKAACPPLRMDTSHAERVGPSLRVAPPEHPVWGGQCPAAMAPSSSSCCCQGGVLPGTRDGTSLRGRVPSPRQGADRPDEGRLLEPSGGLVGAPSVPRRPPHCGRRCSRGPAASHLVTPRPQAEGLFALSSQPVPARGWQGASGDSRGPGGLASPRPAAPSPSNPG